MKRNLFIRAAAISLAVVTVLAAFAGCGKKEDDNKVATPEFVYIPEYITLDSQIQNIEQVAYHDGVLYFLSSRWEESGEPMPMPQPQPLDEADLYGEDSEEGEDSENSEESEPEPTATPRPASGGTRPATGSNLSATLSTLSRAVAVPMPSRAPVAQATPEPETDSEDSEDVEGDEDSDVSDDGEAIDEPTIDGPIMYNPGRSVYDLYKINIDGTGLEKLPNFEMTEIPEGKMGGGYVRNLSVDRDGSIWVQEYVNTYIMDADYNYSDETNSMYLRKLDSTGAEISRLDTATIVSGANSSVQDMEIDSDGNIYLTSYSWDEVTYESTNKLIVIDNNGKTLMEHTSDRNSGGINDIMRLGDGRVGVLMYDADYNQIFSFIDPAAKDFGEQIKLTVDMWGTIPGNEEYDLFRSSGSELIGMNLVDDGFESTTILNWIDSNIDSNNLMVTAPLSDGRVLCITQTYNETSYESVMEFALLTKKPYSELPEREVITLAAMNLDYYMRSDIINFNKTNEKYRIMVTEYGQYNVYEEDNPDGARLGYTKLNTEIITGKVPDILIIDYSMPIKQYAAKGLFDDLYQFIDNDPDFERSDFVQSVLRAMEFDGKLIQIPRSFSIQTYVGRADLLGPDTGITLAELMTAVADNPGSRPFEYYYSKQEILRQCITMGMDSFVDWSTGKCSFNSPEFARLLEFASGFQDTFEWTPDMEYPDTMAEFREGKQLLMNTWVGDFMSTMYMKSEYGDNTVFKGFPTDSRDGHALDINGSMSITSKGRNKDGAWEFISHYLTEEYQTGGRIYNFPVNQKAFDTIAEKAMTIEYYDFENPETGEREPMAKTYIYNRETDESIPVYSLDRKDYESIVGLINSVTRFLVYDEAILKIITDEAEVYFKGQKSAEAAAAVIQDRVSTYINEQR